MGTVAHRCKICGKEITKEDVRPTLLVDYKYYCRKCANRLDYERKRLKPKLKIIEHYTNGKNTCQECGFNNIDALAVVGGPKLPPLKRYVRIMRTWPPDIRILCLNCLAISVKKQANAQTTTA
jgi:hypothetical protein